MFGNHLEITADIPLKITDFNKKMNNKKLDKSTFVWFYADYCGHCHSMHDEWKNLENTKNIDKKINLLKIESDQKKLLSKDPNIFGYPTLRLYKKNGSFVEYNGPRDCSDFKKFITANTKPATKKSQKKKRPSNKKKSLKKKKV